MLNPIRVAITVGLIAFLQTCCFAESIETQSNPVSNGMIHVAPDDADRSDWEGVPWYEFDDDFVEFYPVDIDRVQMAHDASNLYIHIQTLEWDVDEQWRVGAYLDTDQDTTTGYTGDFLPVGADHFLEDALAFEFTAATQADWGWAESGNTVRDQSSMLDVELAIPRSAIGDPTEFDFILFANNFCCDFQTPDDIYPNEPGGVFTYELSEVPVDLGDCNGDGILAAADLVCVGTIEERDAVLAELNTLPGDLNGDGEVVFADFLILAENFGMEDASYMDGNIDLSEGVAFADFLILAENFGRTPALAAAVPEPATSLPVFIGAILAVSAYRSKRRPWFAG